VVTQRDDHGYTLALAVRRGKWLLLGLWAGLAALAIAAAGRTGKRLDVRGGSLRPTEASRAAALLETRFPRDVGETFVLVVTGGRGGPTPVDTARAHAVLDDLSTTLSHEPYVADVAQVAAPHGGQSVALVTLSVSDPDSLLALVPVVRRAVRRALDRLPDGGTFRALVTGDTPLEHDMLAVTTADVERSEWHLVPITGAILLIALGSPVAAVLPLLVGILAIVTARAVVGSVAAALPVSVYALNVTTMIGLAVGIDYSLLVVSRFSEELERDGSATEAASRTLRSAGRTVAASGLTVAVGFAALLATPLIETRSIGVGGLVAVTCAVALALTMLPALLAVLGRGHRFGAWRGIAGWGTQARWERWAGVIARYPGRALLVGGAVIGILTAPLAGIRIGLPARHWWPPGTEAGAGLELLAKLGGAGYVQPIRVTVEWPPGRRAVNPGALRALRALSDSLRADPRVGDVRSLVDLPGRRSLLEYALLYADLAELRARHPGLLGSLVSLDERVARLDVVLADTVSPLTAMDVVRRVRGLAAGSGLLQSARVLVGGYVAENVDVQAELGSAFPLVAGWIFGATAIVLGLVFRSVLIPLKAILLNAASVGAAFGLVVLVFQRGHGSALFGAPGASEAVFAAVPILLFAILFGLSIDYEVFLLGRIAEAYRPAGDNDAATRDGLAASAGVITWAALLMVAVFGVFAFSRVPVIQLLGFGLAAAVLLDATVIRLVLATALLHLAGRWNWWPGGGRGRGRA
jgi:putative drug exporter of the RND superfamily